MSNQFGEVAEKVREIGTRERILMWACMIKDIEPPTNVRSAAHKKILENALRDLGEVGNAVIKGMAKL